MKKTRWSLIYLAFYTIVLGLGGIFFGDKMLSLMGSNTEYGEVATKMVGVLIFCIGLIVAQIARYRLKKLYPTVIVFRLFVGAMMIFLYFIGKDPMFLVVFGIGAVGVIISTICYYLDRKINK